MSTPDKPDDKDERPGSRYIYTQGGSYVEGESKVDGGDFVGRDRTDRQQPDQQFRA